MAAFPGSPLCSKPLRIFVVEDYADTAKYLCLYLELLGPSVICAGTMTQALKKLPHAGCDVLLCDIQPPDGNGWDLLALVDAQLPLPTYAVALSARIGKDVRAISETVGFHRHLGKPLVPSKLDAALNEAANALAAFWPDEPLALHRRH